MLTYTHTHVQHQGAPEILLAQCTNYLNALGDVEILTEELRKRVLQYISKMASKSLRTIALAMKDYPSVHEIADMENPPEDGYTLVGIMGLQDPLRAEVPEAVKVCMYVCMYVCEREYVCMYVCLSY
jgi:Ca2+-transporting ATPase